MAKNKLQTTKISDNIYMVSLAVNQQATVKVDTFKKMVKWGDKNDFPKHLLYLSENHAEHGGILKQKARYLSGKGLKAENETPEVLEFLKRANPKETWNEIKIKADIDKVTYNAFALKVLSSLDGRPLEYYHLDFGKLRISDCFNFVDHSDNWEDARCKVTRFPVWSEGIVEPSIYIYKNYSPSISVLDSCYPKQEYGSALLDIDTDIEVSNFFNKLTKNGFSAGHIFTIYRGGKLTQEAEKDIAERLQGNHGGTDNTGKTIVIFADRDSKGAEVAAVPISDLDKQYKEVGQRNQQKIIMAHGVPPLLYGIKTEGQLGGRNELIEAHELHINNYALPNQKPFNDVVKLFCKLKTGQDHEFSVEQLELIGLELPESMFGVLNQATKENYIKKKYNIDTIGSSETPIEEQPIEAKTDVNPHLKGLSGKEVIDLNRIVRQYTKGQINESQAVMRMAAYGFNEVDAKKYLGIEMVQMSIQLSAVKLAINKFKLAAHQVNEEDEIIDISPVNFKKDSDALRFELSRQKIYLEKGLSISVTDLRNEVLNQLKGNPSLTVDEISEILKIEVSKIQTELEWLTKESLIESTGKGFEPTEKGYKKETSKTKVEVYTDYAYQLKDNAPALLPGGSSREFCEDMVELSKRGSRWSFEAIDKMTNDLGMNAWDYRGGFYTNGSTGETTPDCRHQWVAYTKKRTIKA